MPIIGKILSTFGRRGEVKFLPFRGGDFKRLEGQRGIVSSRYRTREVEIERVWPHKGMWILKIKGIDTMKEAWRLRDSFLEVEIDIFPEEDRPLGYDVYSDKEKYLGKVIDVIPTPAHDVLLTDKDVLIPFVEEWIIALLPQEKKIKVKEPKAV
ncbi:16S rRNA processing protein RimM [bacterium]|nr:16S rRNA processing protein RimM [bacterium]